MYVHISLSYKTYRSQYTVSDSIAFPLLWYIQYMVRLTVSSAVQGLSFRYIGFANSIEVESDVLWNGVLSSWVEKVLKRAVESWLSTADQKAAD